MYNSLLSPQGFPPFLDLLTLGLETFRHRHFITKMFQHVQVLVLRTYRQIDISSPWTFRHMDILAQGIFGTIDVSAWDISAPEHFGTQIFWHLAMQYGQCYCAKISMCQNIPVLKCPRAKTSMVPKNPYAVKSSCRNDQITEMSLYRNVHGDEMSMYRSVCRAKTCTC